MNKGTIAAIATAPGRGGVGVIRISGSNLLPFAFALTGKSPKPRYATLADFQAADGSTIDTGLLLYFPNPHSFTGEDVLELQGHGGPVVLQLLLARCLDLGARLAEPGEFSRRAFLNGKMDLAQAEAVADLIDAATASAARSAVRSLQGEFSRAIGELNEELINLRMLVEATLDFPEEEIDFLEKADARGRLARLAERLDAVLDTARQGALLREGLTVVIAGQPNAGKSSLLNALAGAELAIVTPIAGTTRDRVSETLQIEGVPVHVIDTAGLRSDAEAADEVERIGIARSWEAIAGADAVLMLHDLTRALDADYAAADRAIEARLPDRSRRVHVFNKTDRVDAAHRAAVLAGVPDGERALTLSAKTRDGLEGLRRLLLELAGWHASPDGVFIARERHLTALRRAREHLELAAGWAARRDEALDLFAEELRLSHDALGEITGAFSADDLLGVIFSRFCIGK